MALADQINSAIAFAEIDVADHGETGANANASHSNLNYLNSALEKANIIVAFLNFNSPEITTYSEAGHVEDNIRDVMHYLNYASFIGLEGSDAYQSFEHASLVMDKAHILRVKARRCYMDAYLY